MGPFQWARYRDDSRKKPVKELHGVIVPKSEPQHPGRRAWSSSVFGTNVDRAKYDRTNAEVSARGRGTDAGLVSRSPSVVRLGHQPRDAGQGGIPGPMRHRPGVGAVRRGSGCGSFRVAEAGQILKAPRANHLVEIVDRKVNVGWRSIHRGPVVRSAIQR